MTKNRFPLLILITLGILYIGVRVAWYDAYPPTRNYDHFNTETTLNVLANPSLYPTDPIWKNGGQVSSLGLLFTGFMQVVEAVFGEYVGAWTFLYALHLVIYLPGAYLLFHYLTRQRWLAALLAVASSIPLTMYFSYTSWGISSPYAATFTTVQAPYMLWALMLLLESERRPYWKWAALAVWVSSTTYWNPVNGLALIQLFGFAVLVEWFARRINWRESMIFLGILGLLFGVYYLTAGSNLTATADDAPLSEAELDQLMQGWISFAGLHFFPWTVSKADALRVVAAITGGSLVLLLTAPLMRWKGWWLFGLIVIMCQVPAPIVLTKDTSFLLMAGYWVYRYRRVDRWDALWLSLFTAVNLGSLVQSALGFYLFTDLKILSMASIAFESFRTMRWAFFVLFMVVARWSVDLLREKNNPLNLLAVAFILGSAVSRLGNIGLDDSVVVRPDEDLRHAMPYIGFALAMLGRLNLTPSPSPSELPNEMGSRWLKPLITVPLILLGIAIALAAVWSIPAFKNPSNATHPVFIILLIGFAFWLWELPRQKIWSTGIFGLGMLALVLIPIASYYQKHADHNPSDDFNAAAEWAKEHTANDALFLVVGADAMPFRAQSERSVLTWDVLQIYYFLGPRQLLEANTFINQYASLSADKPNKFRETVDAFEVDFIFASHDFGVLPYPTVFYSDEIAIYYPVRPATRDSFYSLPNAGMSEEHYAEFQNYRDSAQILPKPAIVYSPSSFFRSELLQAMAFMLETGTVENEQEIFDLMLTIEQTRQQHELELEPAQSDALNRWNESKSPEDLEAAGIEYILVNDRWWNLLGEGQRAELENPEHYQLIQEWQGITSAFYRLYRVQP